MGKGQAGALGAQGCAREETIGKERMVRTETRSVGAVCGLEQPFRPAVSVESRQRGGKDRYCNREKGERWTTGLLAGTPDE